MLLDKNNQKCVTITRRSDNPTMSSSSCHSFNPSFYEFPKMINFNIPTRVQMLVVGAQKKLTAIDSEGDGANVISKKMFGYKPLCTMRPRLLALC